jgi:haloacetate dehalogenase
MLHFPGFQPRRVAADGVSVNLQVGGNGPAILLLHGFPETHVAWRKVAPLLAAQFTVVAADLPGYGNSIGLQPDTRHEHYSKRALAQALASAMMTLGIARFAVIGHDRGGRVAYRMALDHSERVTALAVLDIIPTLEVAERLTYETARQMANWFWLAQASSVPGTMIAAHAEQYVRHVLHEWGGSPVIEADAVEEYARCLRDERVIGSICEEYRAGDTIDLEHDREDRAGGRRISCPVLALWCADGFVSQFGDPLSVWRAWADSVTGRSVATGHFMMEEAPEEIAELLASFLTRRAQ